MQQSSSRSSTEKGSFMRKKLVAVGTAIGVAALPLIAATPAAAQISVLAECSSSQPYTLTLDKNNVTANFGDTISLLSAYPGTWTAQASGATPGTSNINNTMATDFQVNNSSGGSITLTAPNDGSNCANQTVTLTFGPGGGGSSSDSSSGPEAVMQQFGKPDSMTCDEAQPEGLNWSGVPSGGWGESWAQWMNDGNGGTVCTRELAYRAGSWVIN